MGLLEDVGRAPQVGQLTRSLEQRSQDITTQARQEKLDTSAIELNTLEANKRRNELQEQQRKQEIRGRAYDMKTDPRFLALDDESKSYALKNAAGGGFADKEGIGTIGSMQDWLQFVESDKETFDTFSSHVVAGKRKAFDAARQEVDALKEKGTDPQKIKEAEDRRNSASADLNASLDKAGKHSQALEKQRLAGDIAKENALALEREKQKLKLKVDALGGKIGATEERLKAILFKEGKFTKEQQQVWDEIRKTPDKEGFLQKVYAKAISKQFVEQDDVDKIMAAASTYYDNNLAPKGEKPSDATAGMPPAEGNEGKTIKDTDTGKRYKSNGSTWELI